MLLARISPFACPGGRRSQRLLRRSGASAGFPSPGSHERVVRRMLDPEHATKAEKIQAALATLGKQMTVEVRDAA